MIFPDKLEVGDRIGVTAVSDGSREEDFLRLDNAIRKVRDEGIEVLETENVRKSYKLESSSEIERANQFLKLWKDEDIKAIIAVSGGEILMGMLPFLNFDKMKEVKPKWVQGYSDPSLLNYVITTKLNIATVNAVNFKSFGMEPWHKTVSKNIDFYKKTQSIIQESFELFEGERVENKNPYAGFNLTKEVKYKSLYDNERRISGRIVGGCIDVLSLLLGTPFDNTINFCKQFNEGMIWYIDNCELNVAGFFRTIWQMKQANWFDNANGFLIGRTAMDKDMFDFSYEDALHKAFDNLNVPVFYDVDIGHIPPQWIMINGSLGEFEFNDGKGTLVQKLI